VNAFNFFSYYQLYMFFLLFIFLQGPRLNNDFNINIHFEKVNVNFYRFFSLNKPHCFLVLINEISRKNSAYNGTNIIIFYME
jgi:hypothetical protein